MANRVKLNNVDHASLRLARRHGAEVGEAVNQLLIAPGEFEAVQREYPILFRRDAEGNLVSFALVGLDRGENLYIEDGKWRARYLPAVVRRGPLFLGESEDSATGSQLAPFIDLDDPRVSESEGEPLFLAQGGNAPQLQDAMRALELLHDGLFLSRAMFGIFSKLELLQAADLELKLGDGVSYRIADVFTVGADRLNALDPARLDELHKSGFLPHAILARASLGNLDRLIEWKAEKLGG